MSSETAPQVERLFRRAPSAVPVLIEIAHAWQPETRRAIHGTLSNISQSGAGVTMAWAVPPSTRVTVLIPAGSNLRLPAEIVWTSVAPGADPGEGTYGLRWMTHLPAHEVTRIAGSDAGPRDRVSTD